MGIAVSGLGLGTIDYVENTIVLDERAAALFDLPANTPIARDQLHARIHKDDLPVIERELACLFDPKDAGFIDVQHRVVHSSGEELWLQARKQVDFFEQKNCEAPALKSGLVAMQDITLHKASEAQIRYLMDELNHRAKNAMGVIQGMVRLTASSDEEKAFATRFSDRLKGLSYNHDALVKSNWDHVELKELVEFHLAAFMGGSTNRVSIVGEPIKLQPQPAQSIGMALHELATNAVKYGALSNEAGSIAVEWKVSTGLDAIFAMTWAEKNGPPVAPPTRQGFGQKVLEQMASAGVNGSVELKYDIDGLNWALSAPLTRIVG